MRAAPFLLVPGAVAGLLAAAAGHAQSPAPAAPVRHDSNAPVNVDSDRLEVQDRADRAVFVGNVRAVQGDMTLTAQRVTVAYARTSATAGGGAAGGGGMGNVQINRLDASGNVVVRQPDQTATGNVAIYDLNRRLITMLGNVTLVRQDNRVHGGRLVLDLNTNKAVVDGAAVAGTGGGVSTGRGGRVSGRFTVPQRTDAPPAH